MSIMTILVSYECVLTHFFVFMDKSSAKMSKLSSSSSLPSDHDGFKNFSVLSGMSLSRCNSYSSCSNDSSVYSGSNPIQTRFRRAKRAIVSQAADARKRSRNSSGSSISSNISGISDKDLRSSAVISQKFAKSKVKSSISDIVKTPQVNHTKVNSGSEKLKKDTFADKDNNSSKNSRSNNIVIFPKQHNLRGKITKKGCTCCPSSCATVVLRHYKKYIKTEEKTVISSTKVKTYIQKKSLPNMPQTNDDEDTNSSSNTKSKKRNWKRKSEMEKLYESLHEIKWAKDFSPDNILRQINVRQAASCSVFGRSPNNANHSTERKFKKGKNFSNHNNSSKKSSNISPDFDELSSCKVISNTNKHASRNCDNEQKITNLQTTEITTTSDIYHCKQNCTSCNSHSSVDIMSCSVSRINVKEININSKESICTKTLVTENGTDYSDDAQLSYTSDESSSAVSSGIVNLQSKPLLDFTYRNKGTRNLSDAEVSEYSTPTFFDIAEEGIRTIDACFREVGAEVIVSTCYDEESSLPLLTSVKESKVSNKALNDNPPVLEPCIRVEFNQNIKEVFTEKCGNQIEVKSNRNTDDCSILPLEVARQTKKIERKHDTNLCVCRKNVGFPEIKRCHPLSKLYFQRAKKIVKKYLKLSQCREQSKYMLKPKIKSSFCNETIKSPSSFDKKFYSKIKYSEAREKYSNKDQSSVLLPSTSKSCEISFNSSNKNTNKAISNRITENAYSRSRIENRKILDSSKNGSRLCDSGKTLKYPVLVKKPLMSQTISSTFQSRSVTSTYSSTRVETFNRFHKEHISHRTPSMGFSSEYNSIKVNRSYNYTHIILLVTRGKSIFLTLEKLRELKDALTRANNDSNCQVLVINGVGDSFCLGLDLKPLVGPRKNESSTEIAVAVKELIETLSEFKKPLAAAVNGPAVGLGMTLLTHADLTIASDKATFCMPYSYLGYMPEGGATLTLPQVVGSTVAMDLLLRGKTLTAREAYNVGLISEVVEANRLPYELVSRVRVLAKNSLCALETTKTLLKMQLNVNLRLVLENEVKLLPGMWLTRKCQTSLRKALQSGILSE